MLTGILCITNPGFKEPYKLFENKEGHLIHNYLIFSVYEHLETYEQNEKGNYRLYQKIHRYCLNILRNRSCKS
jgi:predicted nucleotide-binding protein (sugar kinase/HSP70/actin superfamily)